MEKWRIIWKSYRNSRNQLGCSLSAEQRERHNFHQMTTVVEVTDLTISDDIFWADEACHVSIMIIWPNDVSLECLPQLKYCFNFCILKFVLCILKYVTICVNINNLHWYIWKYVSIQTNDKQTLLLRQSYLSCASCQLFM